MLFGLHYVLSSDWPGWNDPEARIPRIDDKHSRGYRTAVISSPDRDTAKRVAALYVRWACEQYNSFKQEARVISLRQMG